MGLPHQRQPGSRPSRPSGRHDESSPPARVRLQESLPLAQRPLDAAAADGVCLDAWPCVELQPNGVAVDRSVARFVRGN